MEFENLVFDFPPVSQRVEQKEHTRLSIIAAAIALMHEGGEDAVTMRGVARMVEVSERTVYRHFESREVLLDAVWEYLNGRVRAGPPPETADGLVEQPRRTFPRFDEEPTMMRAYLRSLERRKVPRKVKEDLQSAMFASVKDAFEDADARTLRRRAAIVHIITSGYAWDLMVRYWGFDGEEAGEAAGEAVEILLGRRIPA